VIDDLSKLLRWKKNSAIFFQKTCDILHPENVVRLSFDDCLTSGRTMENVRKNRNLKESMAKYVYSFDENKLLAEGTIRSFFSEGEIFVNFGFPDERGIYKCERDIVAKKAAELQKNICELVIFSDALNLSGVLLDWEYDEVRKKYEIAIW